MVARSPEWNQPPSKAAHALVVVEVAEHEVRRPVHDLAHLARVHVAQGLVDHARFDIEHGAAAGAGLAQLVLRAEHGGEGRDLGLAVQVPEAHLGQPA